jgi:UDP-glucoronosyl and UDP-glucosyl transferase
MLFSVEGSKLEYRSVLAPSARPGSLLPGPAIRRYARRRHLRHSASRRLAPRRTAPQLRPLKHVDAVVCHAVHNAVCETLACGLPLVAAPITNDQPVVAQQVVDPGAGIRLRFDLRPPLRSKRPSRPCCGSRVTGRLRSAWRSPFAPLAAAGLGG